jgi:hypothetical protein
MKPISEVTRALKNPVFADRAIRQELARLPDEARKRLSEEISSRKGTELFVAEELVQRMVVEGKLDPHPVVGEWAAGANTQAGLSSKLRR